MLLGNMNCHIYFDNISLRQSNTHRIDTQTMSNKSTSNRIAYTANIFSFVLVCDFLMWNLKWQLCISFWIRLPHEINFNQQTSSFFYFEKWRKEIWSMVIEAKHAWPNIKMPKSWLDINHSIRYRLQWIFILLQDLLLTEFVIAASAKSHSTARSL